MQADNFGQPGDKAKPRPDQRGVRPVLPQRRALDTIFIVDRGRLLVVEQDATDEFGYIEFAVASRDGHIVEPFYVLPNDQCTSDDVLRLAAKAGHDVLIDGYAEYFRQRYQEMKHAKMR